MSTTIEERVTEMRFDNRDFERNVHTSLSTLDKLKSALKLDNAAKGFEAIDSSARKINFSPLSGAVETVQAKFSALEVMAVTALANITNSAVNAGKRLVSSFTMEPIKAGFQEYETQINAVQTILANTQSKGTTLDDVNKALDTLNTYADKTIYNFTEMTRNIGTFTAAGIDLDTSVNAIQGIANLAAISGSTSQQASTAMYQLSQALASGTVKLMDWNSVVNAGMGGQVFQDSLKETARVHGIAIDDMIKKNGSFRETLQEGWLTSEILTETLQKFTLTTEGLTDAQIEQNREMLRGKGYTEEQIDAIFELGKTSTDAATKVKTFTQLMDTLKEAAQSGWTQTWELLIGDFEQAKELWTNVSNYFGDAINKSAEARNNLVKAWVDMGGRTQAIDSIKNAFAGVMNIVAPIKEAFREIFPPTTADQVFSVTSKINELTKSFAEFTNKHAGKIKDTFSGVFSILRIGVGLAKELASGINKLLGNFKGLGGGVLDVTSSFGEWAINLRETITETDIFGTIVGRAVDIIQKIIDKAKEFGSIIKTKLEFLSFISFRDVLSNIWTFLSNIASKIGGVMSKIGGGLSEFFSNTDMASVMKVLNAGIFTSIFVKLFDFVKTGKGLLGTAKDTLTSIKDLLSGMQEKKEGGLFDALKDSLTKMQEAIDVNKIIKIAVAVGVLAFALKTISTIDSEKIESSLGALAMVFAELISSMTLFNKLKIDTSGMGGMIALATSVLILASALNKMSELDWGQIGRGLTAMGGVLLELVGFTKLMDGSRVKVGSMLGLILLASSMKIFASAMSDFSNFDWDQISRSLAAMGGVLLELGVFSRLLGKTKINASSGIGLVLIAASMKIFASVMEDFATFNWDQIGRGLAVMGGALAEIAIATKLMPKNMMGVGLGLVIAASALHIIASAFAKFGNFNSDQIGQSLLTIGIVLTELAVALNFMKGTLAGSAALLVAAAALTVLAAPIKILSKIKWTSLAKSLIAIAGALAIVGAGGAILGAAAPLILLGSVALAAMAASILLLVPAIAAFGSMSVGTIAKGILGLAAGFIVLGAAGAVVGLLAPLILAFGAAILTVGVGVTAFGAGLVLISTGLSMLGGALQVFIESIANSATALADSAGVIVDSIVVLLSSLLDGIGTLVPKIVEVLLKVVTESLASLATHAPEIADSLFTFLIGILDTIAKRLPELVTAAINVIGAFFEGVVNALKGIDVSNLVNGIVGVGLISGLMLALSAVASLVPGAMLGVLGMGVVIAELAVVLAAIGALAQIPGLSWLISEGGDFLQVIGTAIGQFVGGIVGGIAEGATSTLGQVGTNLSDFMTNATPFIEGTKNLDSGMLDGVKALAETILLLTASDILSGLTSWLTGGSSLSEFGKELAKFGPYIKTFSDSISGIDASTIEASANAAKALAEMAKELPNSGGVVSWFSGDNSLTDFGDSLVPFGRGMKAYSNSISGLDPDVVTNSASAAKALAEMAKDLPNSGGLVAWFAGDNSLTDFGDSLVPFGRGMKAYSDSISGLDPTVVTNSASAAKALAELTKELPNSGGLASWFARDNSLSSFGDSLVPFGKGMKAYSDSVSGMDIASVSGSITQAEQLVSLLSSMSGIDASSADGFSAAMKKLAKTSIDEFVNAFCDAGTKVTSSVNQLINLAANEVNAGISTLSARFTEIGHTITNSLAKGIEARMNAIKDATTRVITSSAKAIKSRYNEFTTMGRTTITNLVNGIQSRSYSVASVFTQAVSYALSRVRGYYYSFYSAGTYLVDGFASGIRNRAWYASNVAANMAYNAYYAAKRALHINSPSKLFAKLGSGAVEGFILGVDSDAADAASATANMAYKAYDGMKSAIKKLYDTVESGIDAQPTIRPVLDLSEIQNGEKKLLSMTDKWSGYAIDGTMRTASSIANSMYSRRSPENNGLNGIMDKLGKNISGSTTTIKNEFHITGNNPKEIANEVSRILQQQVERRDAAWA